MGIPVVSFITLGMMWYGGVDYETFKTFGWETVYFVVLSLAFFRIYYSCHMLVFGFLRLLALVLLV